MTASKNKVYKEVIKNRRNSFFLKKKRIFPNLVIKFNRFNKFLNQNKGVKNRIYFDHEKYFKIKTYKKNIKI